VEPLRCCRHDLGPKQPEGISAERGAILLEKIRLSSLQIDACHYWDRDLVASHYILRGKSWTSTPMQAYWNRGSCVRFRLQSAIGGRPRGFVTLLSRPEMALLGWLVVESPARTVLRRGNMLVVHMPIKGRIGRQMRAFERNGMRPARNCGHFAAATKFRMWWATVAGGRRGRHIAARLLVELEYDGGKGDRKRGVRRGPSANERTAIRKTLYLGCATVIFRGRRWIGRKSDRVPRNDYAANPCQASRRT